MEIIEQNPSSVTVPLVKLDSDCVPEEIHVAFSFLVFLKNQLFLPSSEGALILPSKIEKFEVTEALS